MSSSEFVEYFRYGPFGFSALTLLSIIALIQPSNAYPSPQFGGFGNFFQPPRANLNDPATQFAGIGALGTTLFAGANCLTGNCDVSVRPNVGLNFDPNTGRLAPAVSANVQVGNNGIVNPTFNVGGQFNPNSNSGIPITPFVGTGLNVGGNNGGFNPALTSNFALENGQARPQFGGGLNIGSFGLGNPTQFFGK